MSFGNLNILMHKKWHVWRAENLEKVLKDEKEHREQLAREHTQQVQRDREARYEKLGMKGLDKKKKRDPEAELDDALQKARGRGEAEEPVESPLPSSSVNFFAEIERKERRDGIGNLIAKPHPETEAEKKAKEQRDESKYTTYLGGGSIEQTKKKPWWFDGSAPAEAEKEKTAWAQFRQEKAKHMEDPMTTINKVKQEVVVSHAGEKKVKEEKSSRKKDHKRDRDRKKRRRRTSSSSSSSSSSSDSSTRHRKKCRRNDEKESKPSKSVLEPSDEMVRLRTEARRREEAEAERVRHLLRTGHVPPPLERPRPTAPALPGPGGPRGNDDRGHSGGVRDKMRDSGW